jgi:two-component sensor histidine kinase
MTDYSLFKSRAVKWGVIFLLLTLIGLWNIGVIVTEKMANDEAIPFYYPFIDEMTGAYATLALLPFLFWFFPRFPIQRGNFFTRIPLHLGISILYGISHTTLMWQSRKLIHRLAGYGSYDYGQAGYRILMEYHKQFFVYWTIFGIFFLIRYVRKNQERKLKTAQLEEQLTKARLQALQMQLNPHFLFNTLNMISATMYENVKAADRMIASLSDLLRITLKSKDREQYTFEKELEVLTLYVDIMKARFGDRLIINMDIDNKTLNAMVPGFILQPLVENSIKHGMETLETTIINITSRKEENRLVLTIEDNGPGLPGAPDQVMTNGVGLSNTEERLEKLYGPDHGFHLDNMEHGGLRVTIDIPIRTSE